MSKASEVLIYIKDKVNLTGLKQVGTQLKTTLTSIKDFGTKASDRFKSVGESVKNYILKPVGLISGALTAAGGFVLHFALKASGDLEMLQTQLEAVMATQADAQAAFKESIDFSIKTPFTPEEIINTRILLESVGIKGKEAVTSVGEAAGAMGKSITDVATAVVSMETETLRRLGVGLERNGDDFVFSFKNKMGEAVKVTATGFEDAQNKLLGIFDSKFAGGAEKMATTWNGLKSTFEGVRKLFFADLGDGFLPQAKQILQDMIDLLQAGIDSGKINEIGTAIGKWIQKIRDDAATILTQIKSLDDVKTVLSVAAGWLKDKLLEGGTLAANKLAEVAPIVGSKIAEAMANYVAAEKEGERRASQELYGKDAPSFFSKAAWGLDPEYRQESRRKMGDVAREQTGTVQLEIGDTSQQSLADRITAALSAKAEQSKADTGNASALAAIFEQGLSGADLDAALKGMELTAEEYRKVVEYAEQFAEASAASLEASTQAATAAKTTAESVKTAAEAANESNTKVQDALSTSKTVSQQTVLVAQRTQEDLNALVGMVAQIAANQSRTATDLVTLASQVSSMRI